MASLVMLQSAKTGVEMLAPLGNLLPLPPGAGLCHKAHMRPLMNRSSLLCRSSSAAAEGRRREGRRATWSGAGTAAAAPGAGGGTDIGERRLLGEQSGAGGLWVVEVSLPALQGGKQQATMPAMPQAAGASLMRTGRGRTRMHHSKQVAECSQEECLVVWGTRHGGAAQQVGLRSGGRLRHQAGRVGRGAVGCRRVRIDVHG